MDDPLPKTAQDHYTYRINNFHPSLDNIITINRPGLKVRCTLDTRYEEMQEL